MLPHNGLRDLLYTGDLPIRARMFSGGALTPPLASGTNFLPTIALYVCRRVSGGMWTVSIVGTPRVNKLRYCPLSCHRDSPPFNRRLQGERVPSSHVGRSLSTGYWPTRCCIAELLALSYLAATYTARCEQVNLTLRVPCRDFLSCFLYLAALAHQCPSARSLESTQPRDIYAQTNV